MIAHIRSLVLLCSLGFVLLFAAASGCKDSKGKQAEGANDDTKATAAPANSRVDMETTRNGLFGFSNFANGYPKILVDSYQGAYGGDDDPAHRTNFVRSMKVSGLTESLKVIDAQLKIGEAELAAAKANPPEAMVPLVEAAQSCMENFVAGLKGVKEIHAKEQGGEPDTDGTKYKALRATIAEHFQVFETTRQKLAEEAPKL